jgi:hypothetical protein
MYYHGWNVHSRFFAAMPENAAASGGQDIKQVQSRQNFIGANGSATSKRPG